jgi:hypothetical protein
MIARISASKLDDYPSIGWFMKNAEKGAFSGNASLHWPLLAVFGSDEDSVKVQGLRAASS